MVGESHDPSEPWSRPTSRAETAPTMVKAPAKSMRLSRCCRLSFLAVVGSRARDTLSNPTRAKGTCRRNDLYGFFQPLEVQTVQITYHRQPILSASTPPPRDPAPRPKANTRLRYPCHVPRFRSGIMSDTTMEARVLNPPAMPVSALATMSSSMVLANPQKRQPKPNVR